VTGIGLEDWSSNPDIAGDFLFITASSQTLGPSYTIRIGDKAAGA